MLDRPCPLAVPYCAIISSEEETTSKNLSVGQRFSCVLVEIWGLDGLVKNYESDPSYV